MKESYSNWSISLLILFSALLGPVTPVLAHAIGPIPTDFMLDGALKEWTKRPPTLSLIPKSAGARPGKVWIAQSSKGLVIAGKVEGPPPVFAKTPEDMPKGDHVEIWVAIVDRMVLPPIGTYSSLYGIEELHGPADCANGYDEEGCKTWFASQEAHRRLLPRLFVRQWQLAPGVAVETYARPALEGMRKEVREIYQYLSPKGLPEIRFAASSAKGYSFEALIPWEALPPSDRLNLDKLRVMVDIFSGGYQGKYGAFSTTSPNRYYGMVDTLNQVTLTPPRRWRLSPCNYPLVGKNFWGRIRRKELSKSLPAYYLPEQKEEIRTSFFFDNDYYCCDLKPEEVVSPVIKTVGFFSHRLSSRLSICGPELAAQYGDHISYGKDMEIESNANARKAPGGWLVKGAWIGEFRNPGGKCGACENIYLNLHFVPDSEGRPHSAFQMWGIPSGCCWYSGSIEEFTLSDDFQRIRVKESLNDNGENEKTTEFCFDVAKHVYVKCRPEANTKPRQQMQQISPASQESEGAIHAQVSEGLAMADKIKMAVLEYYKSNGRFPVDNAATGIAKPAHLVGIYVSGIRIEEGAIHIQFGNRADPGIAGRWLSLQPVIVNADPGGPISWWCGYAPSIGGMTAQGRNMTSVPTIHLPEECREPPSY